MLFPLLTLIVIAWIYYKWRTSIYGKAAQIADKYPGPPANFIFGNVLQFDRVPSKLLELAKKWYATYGSPMKLQFGPFYTVHIFKANHVEAIFKSNVNIRKSRDYDMLADWLGTGLLISNGNKWHQRRKLLTPTFHFQILKEFVHVFNEQSRVLVSSLQKTRTSETVNVCKYISHCALDIICETAMGKRINAQSDPNSAYVEAIAEFSELIVHRAMRPYLWPDFIFYYLTLSGWKMRRSLKILHAFTRGVIAERIAERESKDTKKEAEKKDEWGGGKRREAFLDLLLEMRERGEINDEGVREEVDTFMFEGHDTTATGMMWASYLLARHPEHQQKVREEIEEILGNDLSTDPTLDDLNKMKYLECCVKESQRLYPPVPIIVRRVDEPLKIDENYTIPEGIMLNIGIFGLHRDPEYFPEPDEFQPERFLPENADGRHPYAFTPFAAGLRSCIGQRFAMLEEKAVLCHLIRNFKLETTEKPEETGVAVLIVYRPTNGIHLKLTPIRD